MVLRRILALLRTFLAQVQSESMRCKLEADLSGSVSMAYLDELATEKGLFGMLENNYFSNIDMVSPFLAAQLIDSIVKRLRP